MKRIMLVIGLISSIMLSACGAQKIEPSPSVQAPSTDSASPIATEPPSSTPAHDPTPTPEVKKEYVLYVPYESEAIGDNMVEEKPKRLIHITLPPSYYDETDKRYPVIYFLHGHGDSPGALSGRGPTMNSLMKAGDVNEYITVEPDCGSVLGGSFYANSPVTGRFEDFVTQELVQFIDENYRTIPSASSRGIAGFSMGGFGAMYLGFRHPDIFSAVFALSPGLFDPEGVKSAMERSWDNSFESNYGAVFSPNTDLPYPHANIPRFDGSDEDNAIIADWYDGFGNWEQKVADYLALPDKLTAIAIEYGNNDNYPFIISGCEYVSGLLNEAGIEHTLTIFDGGHRISPSFVTAEMLPFFDQHLKGME